MTIGKRTTIKKSTARHYYFVTGIEGVCNQIEISPPNNNGKWIPNSSKQYAKLRHYCPVATEQANRYFANRKGYQQAYGHIQEK